MNSVAKQIAEPDTSHAVTEQDFKKALGSFLSGVTLITAVHRGEKFGMAASSFTSVTTSPPTILVCLNTRTSTHDAVVESGQFTVNLMAEEQRQFVEIFSRKSFEIEKFAQVAHRIAPDGGIEITDSLASLNCSVVSREIVGTHSVILGQVSTLSVLQKAPLAYFRGYYDTLSLVDQNIRQAG